MSPVQLPLGLPLEMLQEMVTRFQKFLLTEIHTMMEKHQQHPKWKHTPHRSIESNSGLSIASDHVKPKVWECL